MKDYTINEYDAELFIKNYEIIDNQIICHLASGENFIIPYNKRNLKLLRDRMESQITDDDYLKGLNRAKVASQIITGVSFSMAAVAGFGFNENPYALGVSGALIGIGAVSTLINNLNTKKRIYDLQKNRFFLEEEDNINSNVYNNVNMLSNVSNSTKRLINSREDAENAIELNDLDHIPFKDLVQIVNNIDRDAEFGFSYKEETPDTSYTRTRKK